MESPLRGRGATVSLSSCSQTAPSTVTSTLASETSMRSLTDSTEKPPNTTLCGAPIRAQASIATTTSGIMARKIPTTSPGSTPRPLSALAKRWRSRWRSA